MSVPYVKAKNSLGREMKRQRVIGQILDRLNGIVCDGQKKDNLEFILLVCSLVEHLIVKKDKINKKELVVEVFKTLYPELTDDEKNKLENHIEFLWENKRIKKVHWFRQILAVVYSWFERKIF